MTNKVATVDAARAPRAIGPYSHATVAGGFVFLSGQIPIDPASGELVAGDFAAEVERVLAEEDARITARVVDRDPSTC